MISCFFSFIHSPLHVTNMHPSERFCGMSAHIQDRLAPYNHCNVSCSSSACRIDTSTCVQVFVENPEAYANVRGKKPTKSVKNSSSRLCKVVNN